jgi:ABC-type branched-subunit amino acid transport system substrate-binding protein
MDMKRLLSHCSDQRSRSADSEAIRTVLEGIEVEGLLGTIRIDAENHNAIKPAIIYRMVEGQPLPHKLFKP